LYYKVCYWLVTGGRWFSPGIPVSSTNKTHHHDINNWNIVENGFKHHNTLASPQRWKRRKTPLSTIFQNKLYSTMFYLVPSPLTGFELTTLVVICIGSCKSNYLPPKMKATKNPTFNNISVISWLSSYGIPTNLSYVTDRITAWVEIEYTILIII
jgi:hypothetical protein